MRTYPKAPLIPLIIIVILLIAACKKGEDDPAFSFRTRKNRLCGEWRLKSGSASFNSVGYARKYDFDGSNFTQMDTYTGGDPTVYKGKYMLNVDIKKDGTFHLAEMAGIASMEAIGTWHFNKGIGKNKS